jgi:CHAD domain-containing protein
MGLRLKDAESVPEGIRRITLDEIDRSLDLLQPKIRNKQRSIHEARVCFKRIRAVLRLIYGEIGPDNYKFENTVYRDAGRQLSAARDTAVVADTLEELVDQANRYLDEPGIKLLRKRLRRLRADQFGEGTQILPQLTEDLRLARQRVEEWPLNTDRFSALGIGLKRVYRRGRRYYERTRVDGTVENFHEWRKQVKYLWYQISVLNPVWPKPLDTLASELGKLANYLSEDHDLAVLRERAVQQGQMLIDSSEIDKLVVLINHRRLQLQNRATSLGSRLFAEKPKTFVSRIEAYWLAWRPSEVPEAAGAEQLTLATYAASQG